MTKLLYSKRLAPHLFILPFVLTVAIFWIIPVAQPMMMSFQEVIYGQGSWVGFRNYERLWRDQIFWRPCTTASGTWC